MFGVWDAPVTDDDIPIDPPIGQHCLWCEEDIQEGDNGRITSAGCVEHRECSLRNVMGGIGHLVDHVRYCHGVGPDAGLSRRQSSLLVWEFFQETRFAEPSNGQLIVWQGRVEEAADLNG